MCELFFQCDKGAAGDIIGAALMELVPDQEAMLGTGCKFIFITGRRCIGGSTYKLHFFNPFHHLIKGIGFFIL